VIKNLKIDIGQGSFMSLLELKIYIENEINESELQVVRMYATDQHHISKLTKYVNST
jgi:hypothetical protein